MPARRRPASSFLLGNLLESQVKLTEMSGFTLRIANFFAEERLYVFYILRKLRKKQLSHFHPEHVEILASTRAAVLIGRLGHRSFLATLGNQITLLNLRSDFRAQDLECHQPTLVLPAEAIEELWPIRFLQSLSFS